MWYQWRANVGAVAALALGDLVLVMREEQVDAAGMQVDGLAEVLPDHRAALDVPAWAPLRGAAGAGPFHLAVLLGLIGLPEREVAHVVLVVCVEDAVGDLELPLPDAREGAVRREGSDLEIDRPVRGAVGVSLPHQHLDHVDLLPDVARGRRLDVRWQAVQGGAVRVECLRPFPRDLGQGPALRPGLPDRAVVDVGQVADVLAPFRGTRAQAGGAGRR